MDHRSQPKSRLSAVAFAAELHCSNRAGARLTITSQWQDLFCYKSALQKICRMLKPLVPKLHHDLSVRLKDIAEKTGPVKLKPIAVSSLKFGAETKSVSSEKFCFQNCGFNSCPGSNMWHEFSLIQLTIEAET